MVPSENCLQACLQMVVLLRMTSPVTRTTLLNMMMSQEAIKETFRTAKNLRKTIKYLVKYGYLFDAKSEIAQRGRQMGYLEITAKGKRRINNDAGRNNTIIRSNQGTSPTCVGHCISKVITVSIERNTTSCVEFENVLSAVEQKYLNVMGGLSLIEFNNASFIIKTDENSLRKINLEVSLADPRDIDIRSPMYQYIIVVDMSDVLGSTSSPGPRRLHALHCTDFTARGEIVCVNSWGEEDDVINIPLDKVISLWHIHVLLYLTY